MTSARPSQIDSKNSRRRAETAARTVPSDVCLFLAAKSSASGTLDATLSAVVGVCELQIPPEGLPADGLLFVNAFPGVDANACAAAVAAASAAPGREGDALTAPGELKSNLRSSAYFLSPKRDNAVATESSA